MASSELWHYAGGIYSTEYCSELIFFPHLYIYCRQLYVSMLKLICQRCMCNMTGIYHFWGFSETLTLNIKMCYFDGFTSAVSDLSLNSGFLCPLVLVYCASEKKIVYIMLGLYHLIVFYSMEYNLTVSRHLWYGLSVNLGLVCVGLRWIRSTLYVCSESSVANDINIPYCRCVVSSGI